MSVSITGDLPPDTTAPTVADASRVDPRTLVIDANVRGDVQLDEAFVESIRTHGVIHPVEVRTTTLGELAVVDGQRRVLAAVEAGLEDIPAFRTDHIGDDETRIVNQLVSNDQRAALHPGERAAAYQQLALLGRSAESIAKRVHAPVEKVEQALAVAGSSVATEAATAVPDLTLDQLAAIAEFDDAPDVVEELTTTATDDPGLFRHRLQRARDKRVLEQVVQAAIDAVQAEGLTYAGMWGDVHNDRSLVALSQLRDGTRGEDITPERHTECPGHAVALQVRGYMDPPQAERVYVCQGWKQYGHVNRYATPSSGATSGPQSEEQKAERRRLVENNKAAVAAEKVRREFVIDLLKRPKLPADALVVAAKIFAGTYDDAYAVAEIRSNLLGGAFHGSREESVAAIRTPARAAAYLLAWACARVEANMPKDFWRNRSPQHSTYLSALHSWGYTLSDVEQLVVDLELEGGEEA